MSQRHAGSGPYRAFKGNRINRSCRRLLDPPCSVSQAKAALFRDWKIMFKFELAAQSK